MPMIPFHTLYNALAFRETGVLVVQDHESLPPGDYGFLEYYCDELGCDCRRVILRVHRQDTCELVWASINYGWEPEAFYSRWDPSNPTEAAQAAGAFLDPLNPQTYYSETLLDLFRKRLMIDRRYIQRLKRHYKMFKNKLPGKLDERGADRIH